MGKAVRILILGVGVGFIFADFETPRCKFCTKMPEMSDLCYLGKTRMYLILLVTLVSSREIEILTNICD